MDEIKEDVLKEFRLITNHITAIAYYNSFCEQVKNHTIKLDGTNPLLSLIDKYVLKDKNKRFYKSLDKSTKFYRARIAYDKQINKTNGFNLINNTFDGFNETNSREAPFGIKVPAGRNNIAGVSYLYVANDIGTACAEVKPAFYDVISVAEFENKRKLKIIDFSQDVTFLLTEEINDNVRLSLLFTYIMKSYTAPVSSDEQYLVSQFLSDYIRKAGYDGISYKSFYSKEGVNYTIFNSHRSYFKFLGSKLIVFQTQEQQFLDLNENSIIAVESLISAKQKDAVNQDINNYLIKKLV